MHDIYTITRRPARADFNRADIWCEYKNPAELNELEKWGMPRHKSIESLVGPTEQSNCNPFYSIPNCCAFAPREFLLVGVSSFNPSINAWEPACVAIVDGKVTTLTVFRDNDLEIDLYRYPASHEENFDALREYLGNAPCAMVYIELRTKNSMLGVEVPNRIEIPAGSK